MNFGIWLPYSDVKIVTHLARLAEQSGWQGIFIRENLDGLDSWVPVAAAALCTERIMIGSLISPSSTPDTRRVLKEAFKVHKASKRRLIVCLGEWYRSNLHTPFGSDETESDLKVRRYRKWGRKSSEWYAARLVIWRVGQWPDKKSMAMALNSRGVIPVARRDASNWRSLTKKEVGAVSELVSRERGSTSDFDIVIETEYEGISRRELAYAASAYHQAGATWWIGRIAALSTSSESIERLERFLHQGPPRIV